MAKGCELGLENIKMKFNLEVPCNALGYGQMGFGVAYEIYKRGLEPNILPVGPVDFRPFVKDSSFEYWFTQCSKNALKNYQNHPTLRLWHFSGSERLLGKMPNILWTAHECSELTPEETEIAQGYKKVLVTSEYSKDVFSKHGVQDVEVVPNFFDSIHLKQVSVPRPKNAQVSWGLFGKMEKRKQTKNSLISWANKFGNQPEHRLTCQIFNPFLDPQQQSNEINSWFMGRCPNNISFLGHQETNELINQVYNGIDIIIALNSAEGTNLPLLNCLGLGKHAVVHNATGHKDFCNTRNSVLIESKGQEPIYDGVFFHQGAPFNQGHMPSINYDDVLAAYDKALQRFREKSFNEEGTKIQQEFTVGKTVDSLLSHLLDEKA